MPSIGTSGLFVTLLLLPSITCSPLTLNHGATVVYPLEPDHQQARLAQHIPTLTSSYTLKSVPTTVYRPSSYEHLERARQLSLRHSQSEPVEWQAHTVLSPDITDKHTLSQLSRMAGNAYAMPGQKNWYEMDEAWNTSFPIGWENHEDGFRGQVFATADNSTIVLSIKGTTLQGITSKKDKFNDNLLFSCCCAKIWWTVRTVCNCHAPGWRCDNMCLTTALIQDSLFYSTGVKLIADLMAMYPGSDIWLVGHSLGGALASLLGTTFGFPAVAFESPGEKLAASRLHIPQPPSVAVTHVYHTADPIPQGACTGPLSVCVQAGFALETRCHLGKSIVYDTMTKLGWWSDVRHHVIKEVVKNVIEREDVEWEEGREVPEAKAEVDCVDCHKWEFGDYLEW